MRREEKNSKSLQFSFQVESLDLSSTEIQKGEPYQHNIIGLFGLHTENKLEFMNLEGLAL